MEENNTIEKKNKYDDGKIYKIVDLSTGKMYIGGTTQQLKHRLNLMIANFKKWKLDEKKALFMSAFNIIEGNNYEMHLIENFPCKSRQDLNKQVYKHILENKNMAVNRYLNSAHVDYTKSYYQRNKEKLKHNAKVFYVLHREEVLKRMNLQYKMKKLKEKETTILDILGIDGEKNENN